jgi:fermentation-respiration switch protein FrsA (DUF1100 family)
MRGPADHPPPPADAPVDRRPPGIRGRLLTLAAAGMAAAVGLLTITLATGSASAADNPYQRGPDPTRTSVTAVNGPFANTSVAVPTGYGFNGGRIYYPTDTSQGTFGAIAISPGYTALFSAELAWMGPWLASHGFVVIGIETNSRNDFDTARGTQLLAALDYLTQRSTVRTRIDADRLAVVGHSMGGGGTLEAAKSRPSLQAAVPLTPWNLDKSWPEVRTPTLVVGAENDSVASVSSHAIPFYNSLPSTLDKAYLELNNASHFAPNTSNTTIAQYSISWLKRFVDDDLRYEQFLCPAPRVSTTISDYRNTCPHS